MPNLEILLGTKILLDGVQIGENPKSLNFVPGNDLDVTDDGEGNFTVTVPVGAATIFTATAPSNDDGKDGDFAVKTTDYSLYVKNEGVWYLVVDNTPA